MKRKPGSREVVDKKRRFGSYTVKEIIQLKNLFNKLDSDGSGSIDYEVCHSR